MLQKELDYQTLYDRFEWQVPALFNIAEAVCGRWARSQPDAPAILFRRAGEANEESGGRGAITFAELDQLANKMANLLKSNGVSPGDRVAIILPQMVETAAAHIAIYKLGAIAVPMAMLFGKEGLQYRLSNSGAKAVFLSSASMGKLASILPDLPALSLIISVDGGCEGISGALDLGEVSGRLAKAFQTRQTCADDPALMIYTSGTTGPPKGALHAHRVLLGHLPGVQFAHEFFPQDGDVMWTPADWAWAGGLLNVLLPCLYFGRPVVAHKFDKFSGEKAWQLLREFPITNVFIPPTALKMMRAALGDAPSEPEGIKLRALFSGGETVGRQLQDWSKKVLGLAINEVYGQTECNLVLESCAGLGVLKPGAIGKPVPGAVVAVIDGKGQEVEPGKVGNIAVKRPHPVMFLQYWDNVQATKEKYVGDWLITGDQGFVDQDGYFHFVGRDDDIITSSGYRIGPGEVEDCLLGHEAVKLAAVVGKPDPLRTEIVVAFVVLAEGFSPSDALAANISQYVKQRLAGHEYPREIVFKSALPLTTTGKIIRRALRETF